MSLHPISLRAADIACQLHPHSNFAAHERTGPLVMTRGQGIHVYDDQGKEYIEAMSGLWSATLGFSEPRLVDAATRQLQALPYYQNFADRATEPAIRLAENLIRLAPVPMSKVLFQGSGSEANDTAIKLVWYYHNALGQPAKRKILSRNRAYHGTSVLTGSLSGMANMHKGFNLPEPGTIHLSCPHFYRNALEGEDEQAFSARLAQELEDTIVREGADTIAAFIAEPVMGAGGVVPPPAGYFEHMQAVLRRHDILFIADEVICGLGRTGRWWGSQLYGIEPDIITSAKGLSASFLPISATLCNDKIYQAMKAQTEQFGAFGHGYTYGGHPVCAAVANEAIAIYEERDIPGHVARVGAHFQQRLRAFSEHPFIGEVRGVGLMAALEFVTDKETKASFPADRKAANLVGQHALALGMSVRPLGDSLVLAPPLICSEADIDEIVARLGRAIDRATADLS